MKKISCFIGMFVTSALTFAETLPVDNKFVFNRQSGVYLGLGLGSGFVNAGFSSDWGFVFSPFLGYQVNPYVAVEAGYIHFPTLKDSLTIFSVSTSATQYNDSFYGALKGILPIGTNFQVYAKLGAAYARSTYEATIQSSILTSSLKNKDTGAVFYGALGLGYYFTQHFIGNLEAALDSGKSNTTIETSMAFMATLSYLF